MLKVYRIVLKHRIIGSFLKQALTYKQFIVIIML